MWYALVDLLHRSTLYSKSRPRPDTVCTRSTDTAPLLVSSHVCTLFGLFLVYERPILYIWSALVWSAFTAVERLAAISSGDFGTGFIHLLFPTAIFPRSDVSPVSGDVRSGEIRRLITRPILHWTTNYVQAHIEIVCPILPKMNLRHSNLGVSAAVWLIVDGSCRPQRQPFNGLNCPCLGLHRNADPCKDLQPHRMWIFVIFKAQSSPSFEQTY